MLILQRTANPWPVLEYRQQLVRDLAVLLKEDLLGLVALLGSEDTVILGGENGWPVSYDANNEGWLERCSP